VINFNSFHSFVRKRDGKDDGDVRFDLLKIFKFYYYMFYVNILYIFSVINLLFKMMRNFK